jgi:hypothetical protein
MKRLMAGIIMFLIFSGVALADEFCDKPLGMTFFSTREYVEAAMSREYGPVVTKKDGFTTWFNKGKNIGCFFRQGKLVGVSTIMVGDEVPENIKKIGDTFILMCKTIEKDPDWVFEKKYTDENGGLKMMGVKYSCKKNPLEKMEITITKDPSNKQVSIDLFSYLSGFGVREH